MKLDDIQLKYKEYGKNKFISVKVNSEYCYIYVLVNFNNICENKELNGLAHLCEHIFLKIVENNYNHYITSDEKFSYMGVTDYTYTIFKFTVTANRVNVEKLFDAIVKSLDENVIKHNYIEQSKIEVINECNFRKNEMKKMSTINNFLTNGVINYIPIGNISCVEKISDNNVIDFINTYKNNMSLIFIGNYSYDFSNIKWKISNKKVSMKNNDSDTLINNKLKVSLYETEQVDLFFLDNKKIYNEIEKIMQNLLNFIFIDRIEEFCDRREIDISISLIKKKISNNFKYNAFCFVNLSSIYIDDLIFNTFFINVSCIELKKGVKKFIDYLKSIGEFNLEYLVDNVTNFVLNNDIPLINIDIIEKSILLASKISLNEINYFRKELYNQNYKVVIKER